MSKTLDKKNLIQSINKSIPCIALIGMPGAGKTTIAKRLAYKLKWSFIDSDHCIEATYGRRLQDIVDATDKAGFLAIESAILCSLRIKRCVIATGGSVVYNDKAMEHLRSLGSIILLDVPLAQVQERIALNPERGIVMAEGQTLADLYTERMQLYLKWADLRCNNCDITPDECVTWIMKHLPPSIQKFV
ncbi:MAG: shikimate kinase [Desulfovibrio sp.]|nr:shikimate kinase [Desulfovibrio sp.]